MTGESTIWTTVIIAVVASYVACAVGGLVVSGIVRAMRAPSDVPFPSLPGARWRGVMWLPGRLLWGLMVVGLVEIVLLMAVGMFVFASPLLVLCFVDRVTGRPPPNGRMARWYESIAVRQTAAPAACPLFSPRRRRIADAIERIDAGFSRQPGARRPTRER
jgi:hypothetical protein